MSGHLAMKLNLPRVELDPTQQRKWDDTLAALSWIAPGFVHVLYTMLASSGDKNTALFTNAIPALAATDDYQLMIHPTMLDELDLMERCFIVLHEIMHSICNHVRLSYNFRLAKKITLGSRTLDWDHDYAGQIMDYVINAVLIDAKMAKFPTGEHAGLYDPNIATGHDDWVEVYFKHWKKRPPSPSGGGSGGEKSGGLTGKGNPFDVIMDPHASQGIEPQEAPERSDAQWDIAINTAMEIQRAQGKLSSSLEQFFTAILKPKVSWSEHIKGLLMRLMGSGQYDWRRLDRRLVVRKIGAPSMSGHGCGLVVWGADSSGSIYADPNLINMWFAEFAGLMEELNPREMMIIWCDAKVQRVDEINDASELGHVYSKGAKGGGGTSFEPVFEYIADNDLHPDALIYLTDGYGTFPKKEPEYPVIWGNISGDKVKYPFGAVVEVPYEPEE